MSYPLLNAFHYHADRVSTWDSMGVRLRLRGTMSCIHLHYINYYVTKCVEIMANKLRIRYLR